MPAAKKAPSRKPKAPVPVVAPVSIAKPIEPAKPAKAPKAAPPAQAAKPVVEQAKLKVKLVRDSFTIPKDEYAVLSGLKQRATKLARHTKKSEILRAGIAALGNLSDAAFLAALEAVPPLKTGRPRKDDR